MSNNGQDLWDDPEWDDLRRVVNGQKPVKVKKQNHIAPEPTKPIVASPETSETPKRVELSLNVRLPHIPLRTKFQEFRQKARASLMRFSPKQLKIFALGGGALLILITAGSIGLHGVHKDKTEPGVLGKTTNEPDYKTVLPNGTNADTESGKLGYDSQRKVTSFTDKIDLVDVTVSQQPLPDSFKSDPEAELKKLADNISATQVINNSSPNAYLGNSAKGPQTVVFVKNNLLIFIYAPKAIEKNSWADYITRLR